MLKKVYYKGTELEITYRNDVIFKRTLASNDDISKEILEFILEAVTERTYKNVTVTNTESLGRYVFDKRHYLDIRAEDEEGNIFNIEMQQSEIGEYDLKRFQGYNYRIIAGPMYSLMLWGKRLITAQGSPSSWRTSLRDSKPEEEEMSDSWKGKEFGSNWAHLR